jgi:hypothetical protein
MRLPAVVVAAVGWQWVGSGLAMRGAMMDRASGALARVIRNSGNDFDHR